MGSYQFFMFRHQQLFNSVDMPEGIRQRQVQPQARRVRRYVFVVQRVTEQD